MISRERPRPSVCPYTRGSARRPSSTASSTPPYSGCRPLGAAGQFRFRDCGGQRNLKAEALTAYEAGYIAALDASPSAPQRTSSHAQHDPVHADGAYTSSRPPPRWPLSPASRYPRSRGTRIAFAFTYQNFAYWRQGGGDLGGHAEFTANTAAFANYSWQPNPREGFDISELNFQPSHGSRGGGGHAGGERVGREVV